MGSGRLEVFCIDGEGDGRVGFVDFCEDFDKAVVFFDEFVQGEDSVVEVVRLAVEHGEDVVDERLKDFVFVFEGLWLRGVKVHSARLRG